MLLQSISKSLLHYTTHCIPDDTEFQNHCHKTLNIS